MADLFKTMTILTIHTADNKNLAFNPHPTTGHGAPLSIPPYLTVWSEVYRSYAVQCPAQRASVVRLKRKFLGLQVSIEHSEVKNSAKAEIFSIHTA